MKPAWPSATLARSRSARRRRISTSCVLRTAASSTSLTQAATALPPMIAYGICACSKAWAVRRKRSRTFSTAVTILSQASWLMTCVPIVSLPHEPMICFAQLLGDGPGLAGADESAIALGHRNDLGPGSGQEALVGGENIV